MTITMKNTIVYTDLALKYIVDITKAKYKTFIRRSLVLNNPWKRIKTEPISCLTLQL